MCARTQPHEEALAGACPPAPLLSKQRVLCAVESLEALTCLDARTGPGAGGGMPL